MDESGSVAEPVSKSDNEDASRHTRVTAAVAQIDLLSQNADPEGKHRKTQAMMSQAVLFSS